MRKTMISSLLIASAALAPPVLAADETAAIETAIERAYVGGICCRGTKKRCGPVSTPPS